VLRFSPDIATEIINEDELFGIGLIEKVESRLRKTMPEANIKTSIGRGFAKNEILAKAASINADFIVLGAHGRLGVTSLFLGSVSAAVMMEANCSVLVVRLALAADRAKSAVNKPFSAETYIY